MENEKQMVKQFGEEEFWQHVASGRIEWRLDPWSPNVYNYKDKGDLVKTTRSKKQRVHTMGQEYQAGEEVEAEWAALRDRDMVSHLQEIEAWGFEKGKGKGKGLSLTKGKGKGKVKGPQVLPIEDGQVEDNQAGVATKTEEEQWKELLAKAKKSRDQCHSVKEDCDAAMSKADKAKRLTKESKKDTLELMKGMEATEQKLKQLLTKGDKAMSLTKAKSLLVESANLVKQLKEETKELTQLANKAGSKASTKR